MKEDIKVGDSPTHLAVSTVTNKVYTNNYGFTGDVYVIDGRASKILRTTNPKGRALAHYF